EAAGHLAPEPSAGRGSGGAWMASLGVEGELGPPPRHLGPSPASRRGVAAHGPIVFGPLADATNFRPVVLRKCADIMNRHVCPPVELQADALTSPEDACRSPQGFASIWSRNSPSPTPGP